MVGMVSQEKWDKTRHLIQELLEMIPKGPLPLQQMLEIRGFLMYVVRTYTWMNPYIKGMHNTIDSWREGRAEHHLPALISEHFGGKKIIRTFAPANTQGNLSSDKSLAIH